jgi:hypothetical protein
MLGGSLARLRDSWWLATPQFYGSTGGSPDGLTAGGSPMAKQYHGDNLSVDCPEARRLKGLTGGRLDDSPGSLMGDDLAGACPKAQWLDGLKAQQFFASTACQAGWLTRSAAQWLDVSMA